MSLPLVITSTVFVNSQLTTLTDPKLRLSQYIDSLIFYIKSGDFADIIICDNSGFDYSSVDLISAKAKEFCVNFESLHFSGNNSKILALGKGFGEGEIIAHILMYSTLLKSKHGFIKITGRIKVLNIRTILKSINPDINYFQKIGLNPLRQRGMVDTRLYYCQRKIFLTILLDRYKEVNDYKNYYLECAYHDALKNSVRYQNFPIIPRFQGISGSHGGSLTENATIFYIKLFINYLFVKLHIT